MAGFARPGILGKRVKLFKIVSWNSLILIFTFTEKGKEKI